MCAHFCQKRWCDSCTCHKKKTPSHVTWMMIVPQINLWCCLPKNESKFHARLLKKSFSVVERVWLVKQNSSTRSQIMKLAPKTVVRDFNKKVELVLFGGCLVEVKMGFEISGSCIWQILLSFFILKKYLFASFLSFLKNSREKRPFESKIFTFFVWRTSASVVFVHVMLKNCKWF